MYRDLKPENILLDIDGHIKLSDFGLSKQISNREERSYTFCGSPEYLPPEMILGFEHSRNVDFYTLGWLLYELSVGFPPFHTENNRNLERRIVSGVVRFPVDMDLDAQDLIKWLLATDPEDRPQDFSDIKKHPFFTDVHWGRIAKKEAVPPWIPDLYTWHVPKRFTQIPVGKVFYKPTHHKISKSTYSTNKAQLTENYKLALENYIQKSNREDLRDEGQLNVDMEELMYLDGKLFNLNSY